MLVKENLEYSGIGFPVKFRLVEATSFRGELLPAIPNKEINLKVFKVLAFHPQRFRGAHLRWVRRLMHFSQEELGKKIGLNAKDISQAESKGQECAGLSSAVEKVIRKEMFSRILENIELKDVEGPIVV